ncbi:putative ammonium transporter 3 [Pecten maximus]|uniref:putative ammonium transporter 3 n=1 Tax=Pecten maximus TaxID=6579 RepID=UPI001458BEAE|nr:putative ammonium transporter 3 [Pecten maximus]
MNRSIENVTLPAGVQFADPQTDSIWILSSTFIIFSMQSGFGLLESGSVSVKNEANIMVKNAVDVIFGGLTFWAFGYAFAFGEDGNSFCGWGHFFVNASEQNIGWVYSKFFFQASFATTATTIVSGSMAERTKLEAYMAFSMLNTFIFCLPAHWVWASNGWLRTMGVIDIAGAGPVHIVGGITGLVATLMLKPRHNRFETPERVTEMGSPTNAILGMFMLWWGWLGFNCGSTFGISGVKWILAARSAVSTITASVAGGSVGLIMSYIIKQRRIEISYLINGVLGALVGITANCAMAEPWEGLLIGSIGALITNLTVELFVKLKIDDPVGCVGTHACAGVWSLLSAGLVTKPDDLTKAMQLDNTRQGLFHGGDFYQLGIQALAALAIIAWTLVNAFVWLKLIDLTIGIRVPLEEEILGADIVEHAVGGFIYSKMARKILSSPDSDSDPPLGESDIEIEISKERERSRRHSLGFRVGQWRHRYENASKLQKLKRNKKQSNNFSKLCHCLKRDVNQNRDVSRGHEDIYSVDGSVCFKTSNPLEEQSNNNDDGTFTNTLFLPDAETSKADRGRNSEHNVVTQHRNGFDRSPPNKIMTYL